MKTCSLWLSLLLVSPALAQNAGRERGRFSVQGGAPSVLAVDPTVKSVLVAYDSGTADVFPIDQKIVSLRGFIAHKKPVTGGAFLPDGRTFLTSSGDGTVKYWDTLAALRNHAEMEKSAIDAKPENLSSFKTINAHIGYAVNSMSLSADGKLLLTAGSDNSLKIWEAEDGKLLHTVRDAQGLGGVKQAMFAPDGKQFATAGPDKTARIWEVAESGVKIRFKVEGHEGAVNSLSFSPDGKHLATASGVLKKSGSIRVWDTATGKLEYKLEGSTDNVTAVLFSQKGDTLAGAGHDLKIRVWNLEDKKEKYSDNHAEPIKLLMNTPDGKYLGSISKTSIRWWAGIGK